MDEKTRKKIDSFSWYQTIEFEPGITSKGSSFCGDPAWKNIKFFLPDRLDGKRVLDLGCNAGIFCVRAALLGASCIGVENDSWKNDSDFYDQSQFVRDFFERKIGGGLDISYWQKDMEEVVHDSRLGIFDYCFGIASLYYAKDQERLINRIYQISENVIVRIREDSRIKKLTKFFKAAGYKQKGERREEMWKVVGQPTDDFYLFHYAR